RRSTFSEERHGDDQDQDPFRYSKKKKKRRDVDKSSSKKDDMEIEQDIGMTADDVQEDDTAPTQDRSKWFKKDVVVRPETPDPEWHKESNDAPEQNDTAPTQDRSKWFKKDVVVRPETPDPEWHKESNDAPEQSCFNDMLNAYKGPATFDDILGSVVDFTNFTKKFLQKDKITKVDLEGPAFKLLKEKYKNYIELEYNFQECYRALIDLTDMIIQNVKEFHMI
nr:hypothetical protein [Tanacetum cinerariifolium]